MKVKIILISVVVVLLGSVFYLLYSFQWKRVELSQYPEYIYSDNFESNKVLLYGISFGNEENKINTSLIDEPKNSAGWIHMKNDVGYRIANGRVVEMVLRETMVKKIGIMREDEIVIKFGQPDKIEENKSILYSKNYIYNKGLIIRIGKTKNIELINIISK